MAALAASGPPSDQQLAVLIGVSLAEIEGPILISTLLELLLLGIVLSQYTAFVRSSPWREATPLKWPVTLSLLLFTGNVALDCSSAWQMAIQSNYLSRSLTVGAEYIVKVWLGYNSILICQGIFLWRLFVLTGRKLLCGALALIAVTSDLLICIAVLVGNDLAPLGGAPAGVTRVERYAEISFWLSVIADLAIAGCLSVYLARKKSGFNVATDGLINRILRLVLGNAVIVAAFQLAACISIRASAGSFTSVPILFEDLVIPFYMLSVLFSLNARQHAAPTTAGYSSEPSYARHGHTTSASGQHKSVGGATTPIHISTTVDQRVDQDEEKAISFPPARFAV